MSIAAGPLPLRPPRPRPPRSPPRRGRRMGSDPGGWGGQRGRPGGRSRGDPEEIVGHGWGRLWLCLRGGRLLRAGGLGVLPTRPHRVRVSRSCVGVEGRCEMSKMGGWGRGALCSSGPGLGSSAGCTGSSSGPVGALTFCRGQVEERERRDKRCVFQAKHICKRLFHSSPKGSVFAGRLPPHSALALA